MKSKLIVDSIKAELRTQKVTYRALARHLEISESAVKHMFSSRNFSLKRLDAVLSVLNLDIGDIVMLAADRESKLESLSIEQEVELTKDLQRLVVVYAVINFWTFKDIIDHYKFTEPELIKHLTELEKMGFLELHLNNRIKSKVSTNFNWNLDGPIEGLFKNKVLPDFFSSNFIDYDATRVVKNGDLTENSRILLTKRINLLNEYFDELCFKDRNETLGTKRRGTSLVLGMRKWSFFPFIDMQKK